MGQRKGGMRISDFGLRLILLQIRPGSERRVSNQFVKSLPGAHRYKCLGKFDLLVLHEFNKFDSLGTIDAALLDSSAEILQFNHIVCYGLDTPKSMSSNEPCFKTQPFMVVIFLKLQHNVVQEAGGELGYRLAERFAQETGKESGLHSIYGSLGWNELVMISWSTNLANPVREILALGKVTTRDLGLPGNEQVFIETFSIPTINYGLVDDILAEKDLRSWKVEERKDVEIQLHLTCAPGGGRYRVLQKVKELFGTEIHPAELYGKDDMLIKPKIPLVTYINKLWALRHHEEISEDIFATSTSVSVSLEHAKEENETQELPAIKSITAETVHIGKTVTNMAKDDYPLYKSINDIFCSMNAYYRDPVLFDAFLDMAPFIKRLAVAPEEECFELGRRLWVTLGCFTTGFKQRFVGSLATVFEMSELILTYQAGLQRVAHAANLIPATLIAAANETWNGFTVFGTTDRFIRYDFGIMNLPYDSMFSPTDWFGMFHEVGHDLAHKRQIFEQEAKPILTQAGIKHLDIAPEKRPEPSAEQSGLIRAVTEIYADMFAFVCGFRSVWNLYSNKVLEYVFNSRQARSHFSAYFNRAFMIFCHSRGCHSSLADPNSEDATRFRRKLIDELLDEIKRVAPGSVPVDNLTLVIRDAHRFYQRWSHFTEWAANDVVKCQGKFNPDWQKISTGYVADLERGIIRDDIDDPIGIILLLPKDEACSMRLNLAVILSFSVVYHKNFTPKQPVYIVRDN